MSITAKEAVDMLIKYIELGQSKGSFKTFQDAYLFKRAFDVLLEQIHDPEITVDTAITIISQGLHVIQGVGGVFTITDASEIFKLLQFLGIQENRKSLYNTTTELGNTLEYNEQETHQEPQEIPQETPKEPEPEQEPEDEDDFDLSELSQPVPLKINHV